ncbi:hypothetical protein SAMN05421770_10731 [Granulicella rosea]|uniref:Uncharacterized protein n=1 Tax=Granulicella rosea TaxID=474952 RepID=A0A239LHK6_9BACT|nr:hypothetical protein [Granulicella rosea]SNT29845.1 hypothetical protein SAMN05421770_10731 [Granulicella rosea]
MSVLPIFLLIFVIVIYMTVKASWKTISASKPSPEALDLISVRDAVMEKRGWSAERAEAARIEYLRFLTLLQTQPGFMVIPWPNAQGEDDLDQFWHQHILDTRKYANDCDLLFGRLMHHNPHVVQGSEQELESVKKTQRLYARRFGSDTNGGAADTLLLTGCSTCGASSSSHHSGDGGHGGDSAGHGCGSHGCGGHSCGHGCGGH